jgi:Tol biopolymer transport system component
MVKRNVLQLWLHILGLLVLIAFLTACLPEGVRLPESPLLSTLERKSGLIVYIGLDGNVYTIDQGGGEPTAITNDAQLDPENEEEPVKLYQLPAWSPDERQVAFIGVTGTPGAPEEGAVYTAAADGSNLKELFQSEAEIPFYLYWAPDGKSVSFLTNSRAGADLLLQLSSVSEASSQVLDAASPMYWSWAPDGSQLLLHASGNGEDARLSRLTLGNEGEPLIEEVLPVQPLLFQAPEWSPDGRSLLFAGKTEEGNTGLLLLNEGEEAQTLLETTEDKPLAFSWSPDGRHVAYITNETAEVQGVLGPLNILTVDGSQEIRTSEESLVVAFFWSPDSEKLAYFTPVQIPVSDEENAETVLGLTLQILDAMTGKSREIITFRPSNAFLNVIPFFDQYHRSATIWSPDSSNLLVNALAGEDSIPYLFVVAASGALDPRPIAPGIVGFWSWE